MFVPDLSFRAPAIKPFIVTLSTLLALTILAGFLRLLGIAPHEAPLASGAPEWYRILGYFEWSTLVGGIGLWANIGYNSILEATPDSPDGDPVHLRSPILWRDLLFTTITLPVAFFLLSLTWH